MDWDKIRNSDDLEWWEKDDIDSVLEEYPEIKQQDEQCHNQTVLLDKEGINIVTFGVGNLDTHSTTTRTTTQQTALVDCNHRTFGVGEFVDILIDLRIGPQVHPGRDTSARSVGTTQAKNCDKGYS